MPYHGLFSVHLTEKKMEKKVSLKNVEDSTSTSQTLMNLTASCFFIGVSSRSTNKHAQNNFFISFFFYQLQEK
jgi:hypothetical protein